VAAEQPFNPLDRLALAQSIQRELLSRPCESLPPPLPFEGAGVYAIYYSGDFPAYEPIASDECERPIYVGKAVPPGSRRGGFLDAPAGRALYNRLREHAESVMQATNLDGNHFRCRYLVVEDIWIPLGETILISHARPVWNFIVDGFGKHAPGRGREAGRRSLWDELHPGRPWSAREQPAARTSAQIVQLVEEFFAGDLPVVEPVEE
jgi:hypothetical protein